MSMFLRLGCQQLSSRTLKLLSQAPKINRQTTRSIFQNIGKKSAEDYKLLDNIPDQYKLIYNNGMYKYIIGGQITLTVTTAIVIFLFGASEKLTDLDLKYEEWSQSVKRTENEGPFFIACFVLFTVILHIFLTRCTLRIYKRPGSDQYVLINPGNLPFFRETINFKRGQLVHLEPTGVLPWRDSRYTVQSNNNNQRLILVDHYFKTPADLNIMIGLQRDPEIDRE